MKIKGKNQVIVLAERPTGMPSKKHLSIRGCPDVPEIEEGQVLLKSIYISVDPGMGGFVDKGRE